MHEARPIPSSRSAKNAVKCLSSAMHDPVLKVGCCSTGTVLPSCNTSKAKNNITASRPAAPNEVNH